MYRARGDYVRGYYTGRGDPGFLSAIGSVFSPIAKVVGGAVGGFLGGGPVGGIVGAVGGAASAVKGGISAQGGLSPVSIAPVPASQTPQALIALHAKNVATHPVGGSPAGTPHGQKLITKGGGAAADGTTRGMHLDKKTKSYMVRNRSMNPYNPRALGRAERRIHRFVKMATHLIRWVHPHKTGRAVPKFGGRRKRR